MVYYTFGFLPVILDRLREEHARLRSPHGGCVMKRSYAFIRLLRQVKLSSQIHPKFELLIS